MFSRPINLLIRSIVHRDPGLERNRTDRIVGCRERTSAPGVNFWQARATLAMAKAFAGEAVNQAADTRVRANQATAVKVHASTHNATTAVTPLLITADAT